MCTSASDFINPFRVPHPQAWGPHRKRNWSRLTLTVRRHEQRPVPRRSRTAKTESEPCTLVHEAFLRDRPACRSLNRAGAVSNACLRTDGGVACQFVTSVDAKLTRLVFQRGSITMTMSRCRWPWGQPQVG
jgi:hypothetical protein